LSGYPKLESKKPKGQRKTEPKPLLWVLEYRVSTGDWLPVYKRQLPSAKAQKLKNEQKRKFRGEYRFTTMVNNENVEDVEDHFHRSRMRSEEYKALGDALHRWILG
jgi:hypothetical protein